MSLTTVDKNITAEVASWIDRHLSSSPGLGDVRKIALEEFKKQGLPANKSEEYKYTPITRALEKNFNFSLTNPAVSSVEQSFKINEIDANVLVFINGVFSLEQSSIISPASELTISTLTEALKNNEVAIATHLSKYADVKSDALTAWNTAAWTNGVFINVPAKAVVEKPILIYHINDASKGQVISITRNLFIVGKNSEVTVLEKFDSVGAESQFTNIVTEAIVNENAGLNFYSIQNDKGKHFQYNLKEIQQTNSSRLNTFTFTLDGKLVRNNLHLVLDGENIESHMYGLYLLSGDTLADNHTVADHKKPNSFSNELYKGIMDDTSKGVFNGKVYVRPQAQKTNAFQANRNILLSNTATVNTKPQLEIWADDVKCSHGCTSGQLDEEALFYLQSRGIKKETARAMMLYAFAGELLENVKHPVIKEYIDTIISERLHKNF
jgi:Fe-S cluster assembly protein SufD